MPDFTRGVRRECGNSVFFSVFFWWPRRETNRGFRDEKGWRASPFLRFGVYFSVAMWAARLSMSVSLSMEASGIITADCGPICLPAL